MAVPQKKPAESVRGADFRRNTYCVFAYSCDSDAGHPALVGSGQWLFTDRFV